MKHYLLGLALICFGSQAHATVSVVSGKASAASSGGSVDGTSITPLDIVASGAAGIKASSFTATYGLSASTAVITYVQASSITTTVGGDRAIYMGSGGATGGTIQSGGAGSDAYWRYFDTSQSAYVGLLAGSGCGAGNFSIYASGCRAKFTQGGFVGIGTTVDPGTKLHMSSGTLTVDGTAAEIRTTGNLRGENLVLVDDSAITTTTSLLDLRPANGVTRLYDAVSNGQLHIYNGGTLGALFQGTGVSYIEGGGFRVGATGTAFVRVLKTATASTDLGGSITATCTAETNFSVTGVAVGDSCTVTTPAAIGAGDWIVCRTLVDNVALKYCTQGSAIDPAAMVYHITTIEY